MSAVVKPLDGAQGVEQLEQAPQGSDAVLGPQAGAEQLTEQGAEQAVDQGAAETETATVPDPGTWPVPVLAGLGLGATTAALAWVSGWPVWGAVMAGVAGAGLGILAVLDYRTMLVRNRHNLWFFLIAAAAVTTITVLSGSWVPAAFAAGSAVFAFVFLFVLGVVTGTVGGGDVKLVASPALLVGAFNPLVAIIWLLCTFILATVVSIIFKVLKATGRGEAMHPRVPMVPLLAIGMVPAVPLVGLYLSSIGLA